MAIADEVQRIGASRPGCVLLQGDAGFYDQVRESLGLAAADLLGGVAAGGEDQADVERLAARACLASSFRPPMICSAGWPLPTSGWKPATRMAPARASRRGPGNCSWQCS